MAWNWLPGHSLKHRLEKLREVTIYDITHGVDTATDEWSGIGAGYQAAYTSEIQYWYDQVHEAGIMGKYDFIDVGCGKGKAMLVWGESLKRAGIKSTVYGIEADASLGYTAMRNLHKRGIDNEVAICNALDYDYAKHDKSLMVWMFNPFGADQVRAFSDKVKGINTMLIYNNPQHAEVLHDEGWFLTTLRSGEQGYTTTAIMTNVWMF